MEDAKSLPALFGLDIPFCIILAQFPSTRKSLIVGISPKALKDVLLLFRVQRHLRARRGPYECDRSRTSSINFESRGRRTKMHFWRWIEAAQRLMERHILRRFNIVPHSSALLWPLSYFSRHDILSMVMRHSRFDGGKSLAMIWGNCSECRGVIERRLRLWMSLKFRFLAVKLRISDQFPVDHTRKNSRSYAKVDK